MSKTQIDLQNMGKRGREWMINEFSWSHISMNMSYLYQWLIDPTIKKPDFIVVDDKI
jgi:hypothetical protein